MLSYRPATFGVIEFVQSSLQSPAGKQMVSVMIVSLPLFGELIWWLVIFRRSVGADASIKFLIRQKISMRVIYFFTFYLD